MILIEETEVVGLKHAIRGMRNPLNSWDMSDTDISPYKKHVGPKDFELMMKLAAGGPVHAKYRRMIIVYVDITAPLYWWKEFDTYRVGVVPNPSDIEMNSCSTMHKIHAKEFTFNDFSVEHLQGFSASVNMMEVTITGLNYYRQKYLETKDKNYWWQLIQLLPTSYNQKRTVMLNYEVLSNIYESRKSHKLDEWRELCSWITELPCSEVITIS